MNNLIEIASSLMGKAFLKTVEESLSIGKNKLISASSSAFLQILSRVSGNFIIELSIACLKSLLESKESLRLIEKDINKLVREPLKTGIEQLRVAEILKSGTEKQSQHRVLRYQQALINFDKALSLAEENEKPFINFLRGLVAIHLPGAEEESIMHLKEFQGACLKAAKDLKNRAAHEEVLALENEREAEAVEIPRGPGVGGGLIGMARAEPLFKKAQLLYDASKQRKRSEALKSVYDQMLITSSAIEILISLLEEKLVRK